MMLLSTLDGSLPSIVLKHARTLFSIDVSMLSRPFFHRCQPASQSHVSPPSVLVRNVDLPNNHVVVCMKSHTRCELVSAALVIVMQSDQALVEGVAGRLAQVNTEPHLLEAFKDARSSFKVFRVVDSVWIEPFIAFMLPVYFDTSFSSTTVGPWLEDEYQRVACPCFPNRVTDKRKGLLFPK